MESTHTELSEILMILNDIQQDMLEIKGDMRRLKESCKKMDNHISFVEMCMNPFKAVLGASRLK